MYTNDVDSELLLRLDNLEKLYELVDTHVLHNFILFWTIIIGVFAIIGVALYFIAQRVAESGVRKQADIAEAKLDAKVKEQDSVIKALSTKLCEYESIAQGERIVDGEKEYLSPPMFPGVEYRTFERFLGTRPVYTRLIPLGFGPVSAIMTITIIIPNVDVIIRHSITDGTVLSGNAAFIEKHGNKIQVIVDTTPEARPTALSKTDDDRATEKSDQPLQLYVQIWYTKKS